MVNKLSFIFKACLRNAFDYCKNNMKNPVGRGFMGFCAGMVIASFIFLRNRQSSMVSEQEQPQPAPTEQPTRKQNTAPVPNIQPSVNQIKTAQVALAAELFSTVKILCWVMTVKTAEDKHKAILETWGRKCQKLFFMVGGGQGSNATEQKVTANSFMVYLPMKEEYNRLWLKTKLAFRYVNQSFQKESFDWVLKIDDDSYVIMENLRLFLREKKPSDPHFYGCPYKSYGGYNSGGPGYVLSAENVGKFVSSLSMRGCSPGIGGAEDVEVAKCLRLVGIEKADTRDEQGRFRFSPFEPLHTIHAKRLLPKQYRWFWSFSEFPITQGLECCADSFISFHYISPDLMRVMEFLIYHASPFSGRDIWDKALTKQ